MSAKGMSLLAEPLLQDSDRVYRRNVRILLLVLLASGISLVISQMSGGQQVDMQQEGTGKSTKMLWSITEPTLTFGYDKEPFEPSARVRHLMAKGETLATMPRREDDFDLWPDQERAQMRQYDGGSVSVLPRRDPFKDISMEADLPAGQYATRSFVSKSHVGPDGKIVTERYASSATGNGKERIHESKHLYTNSSLGVEKASHEQLLHGRVRMVVTEYGNGKKKFQMFHSMNKTGNKGFSMEFEKNAKHLPARAQLGRDALIGPRATALGDDNRAVASLPAHDSW